MLIFSAMSLALEVLQEQFADACGVFLDDLGDAPLLRDAHRWHADVKRLAMAVAIIGIEQHRLTADGGRDKFLARAAGARRPLLGGYPQQRVTLDRGAMLEHAGQARFMKHDRLGLQ